MRMCVQLGRLTLQSRVSVPQECGKLKDLCERGFLCSRGGSLTF